MPGCTRIEQDEEVYVDHASATVAVTNGINLRIDLGEKIGVEKCGCYNVLRVHVLDRESESHLSVQSGAQCSRVFQARTTSLLHLQCVRPKMEAVR